MADSILGFIIDFLHSCGDSRSAGGAMKIIDKIKSGSDITMDEFISVIETHRNVMADRLDSGEGHDEAYDRVASSLAKVASYKNVLSPETGRRCKKISVSDDYRDVNYES